MKMENYFVLRWTFCIIYCEANVKLLVSASFAWAISGQVVARMSYAHEKEDLVRLFYQVYVTIRKLWIE